MKNKQSLLLRNKPLITNLIEHRDTRGSFVEILKKVQLSRRKTFGHISITTAYPKQTKGGHYHKVRSEWFLVISGRVRFTLQNAKTKEKRVLTLSSPLKTILIPPFWYHLLTNVGTVNAIVLLYSDLPFNKKSSDVYTKF